jgi:hypothetical protein
MYLFHPRLAVTISLDLNVKSYEIILGFNQSWNEWTSKLFQRFVSNLRIKGIDSVPINLFLWNGNSPGGWTRTIQKRAKLFHFGGRVFMNFVGVNSLIYKGVYYCFLIQAWLFNFSMLRFNLGGGLRPGISEDAHCVACWWQTALARTRIWTFAWNPPLLVSTFCYRIFALTLRHYYSVPALVPGVRFLL